MGNNFSDVGTVHEEKISNPANIGTVLVTIRFFDKDTERWLVDQGISVRRANLAHGKMDTEIPEPELHQLLEGVDAWILGAAPAPRSLIESFPCLKVLARRGVGYDNVDTQAAADHGKVVTITPGGNEIAVAEHAIGMMLALLKRLREFHTRMADGNWDALSTSELQNKTVGLLGFGRISEKVARRVQCFDAKVIATDPFVDPETAGQVGVSLVDLDTLFRQSDILSLHTPLTPDTKHIVNRASLAQMRPGSIVISTGRGGLIDEAALLEAIESNHIAGAGLDVFEAEIEPGASELAKQLIASSKVICSPHAAGSSLEGLARANMLAARCVRDVLTGGMPQEACLVRPKVM